MAKETLKNIKEVTAELEKQKKLEFDKRQTDKSRAERLKRIVDLEAKITEHNRKTSSVAKQINGVIKGREKALLVLNTQSGKAVDLSKEMNQAAIEGLKYIRDHGQEGDQLNDIYQEQYDTIQSVVSGTNDIGGLEEAILLSKEKQKKMHGENQAEVLQSQKNTTKILEGEKKRLIGLDIAKEKSKLVDQLTGGMASKATDFGKAIMASPKLAALGAATATVAILAKIAGDFAEMIGSVGKQFGSLKNLGEDFKNTLFDATVQVTKLGGSIGDVIGITNALSSEFGITLDRAAEMSPKVFDISKAIGLSVDETSKLLGTFMQLGGLTLDQAENLTESTAQLARQVGVNPQAVLKDIAGSTEAFAMFSKDGSKNFAEAAIQARAFGTSIDATAKAMRGVLNFQESITKEVDASAILGTQLNLQRARELALSKDVIGFQKEIKKQLKDIGDFQGLNVFEQEALSEALGYSLVDLNKMLDTTKALSLEGALASKSFEDLLGVEGISQIERLSNEFKSLAVNLVKVVGPFLEATAKFLNWVLGGPGRNEVNLSNTATATFGGSSLPTNTGLSLSDADANRIGKAMASNISLKATVENKEQAIIMDNAINTIGGKALA